MTMEPLFKKYLIKFNYPNIKHMSEDELPDIFNASNRLFLLSWMVSLIDAALSLDPSSAESAEILADFIYEEGYCKKSQKDAFVRGDLVVTEQMLILNKMFMDINYLHDKPAKNFPEKTIDYDVLESYVRSKVVNLFPELGPMKCRNLQEYRRNVDEMQRGITDVNKKIAELEQDTKKEVHAKINDSIGETIVQDQLIQSATCLHANASILLQRKCNFHKSNFDFGIDVASMKETDQILDCVLKSIKNTKVVMEFPALQKLLLPEEDQKDEEFAELVEIIKDVASIVRNEN